MKNGKHQGERSKKMINRLELLLVMLSVCTAGALPQVSRPRAELVGATSAADDTWISFWEAFRTAVRKRDRVALRSMMTEDFQFYADGASPDQAIKFFDTWDHGRDWIVLDKLVSKGTEPYRSPDPHDKGPSRIAPAGHSRNKAGRVVIFNFGNKGRWRWTFYGQIEGN